MCTNNKCTASGIRNICSPLEMLPLFPSSHTSQRMTIILTYNSHRLLWPDLESVYAILYLDFYSKLYLFAPFFCM